uniref:Putative Sodium/calcium exchange protein-like protein n=1 Tax=Magnetococcus massalia (strain MO-1) TaxID=451514 RepID=A0A1S7LHN4_MAGMO|nr:putative Sodium/calcium exchange protein-like protein [Candidatus Magnetococcus massalia]
MKQFIIDSVSPTDMISWAITALFFCVSALIFGGDLAMSFIGAGGVVFTMFLVGTAIEIMIETMKDIKGIGTLTGFLTNGPEALVVIVGLIAGDILFASSTPLGSNFMNPLLLLLAAAIVGKFALIRSVKPVYVVVSILLTATLAGGFYALPEEQYGLWLIATVVISSVIFFKRPPEGDEEIEDDMAIPKFMFFPAFIILLIAGYFLDPVVNFASDSSQVPKGVIGFVVLSILTSWPEFKSTSALLRRNKGVAAILNIVVSNVTNLWLAVTGVAIYLMM